MTPEEREQLDELEKRVTELERHVPKRIDSHESELASLRTLVHQIDQRTSQVASMVTEDHARIAKIHSHCARIMEILELVHGKTVVVKGVTP